MFLLPTSETKTQNKFEITNQIQKMKNHVAGTSVFSAQLLTDLSKEENEKICEKTYILSEFAHYQKHFTQNF